MAVLNRKFFVPPEAPFILDDLGVIIGMIAAGKQIFFPGSYPYNNLTAFAGGGQASAIQLQYGVSRVTTVASAADSVKLPKAQAGMSITVINAAAANAMNVFPSSGEVINALSADTALSVAANKAIVFTCAVNGTWNSNLTA